MASPFDSLPSDREFHWGGRVATFLREDGIYVFGRTSQMIMAVPMLGTLAIILVTGALTINTLSFLENFVALLLEMVVGTVLFFIVFRRKYASRKAISTFGKDVRFEDLLSSGIKYRFFEWSRVYYGAFDKSVLNLTANSGLRPLDVYMTCTPEHVEMLRVFLSEKMGKRFRG